MLYVIKLISDNRETVKQIICIVKNRITVVSSRARRSGYCKPVELQSVFKTDIPSTVSKLPFGPKPEIILHGEHTVVRTGTGTSMLNRFMPHDDVKRLRFELGAL